MYEWAARAAFSEAVVLEFARLIRELVPSRSRIVFRPLPSDDPRRRRPDITLAGKLLGWSPKVPLRQGLAETAAWFAASAADTGTEAVARPAE